MSELTPPKLTVVKPTRYGRWNDADGVVALGPADDTGVGRRTGKPLKSYDVYLDSECIGRVYSSEVRRSFTPNGSRIATRTSFVVEWFGGSGFGGWETRGQAAFSVARDIVTKRTKAAGHDE